ncbi:MAG: hypothetical protein Q7S42_06040, partial [Candidatus Omnitrophota bacterium]|nr:hypothetical protein [Candidatus Omnitrophota bacterium]
KIIITGVRQEDGSKLNEFSSYLKPSGLWIPNNLDSPVAEFNETIAFPGKGTYKISCQIKNPAGLTSAIKVFWVKVITQSSANIIVHCHNPEGKEIGSIKGLDQGSVGIYDGDALIGSGAYDANTHGKPISIPSGSHTIKAKFNGMTMVQNIDIAGGATQELTFTFTRTEKLWKECQWYTGLGSATGSGSWSGRLEKTNEYSGYHLLFNNASGDYSVAGDIESSDHNVNVVSASASVTIIVNSHEIVRSTYVRLSTPGYNTQEHVSYRARFILHTDVPIPTGFTTWYKQAMLPSVGNSEAISPIVSDKEQIEKGGGSCYGNDSPVSGDSHTYLDEFKSVISSVPY